MFECREEKKNEETSGPRFTSIYILSGFDLRKGREFIKVATNLGKVLVARNINLVCGGGNHGLKGCVTTFTFVGGSKLLGIVLKDLINKNSIHYAFNTKSNVTSIPKHFGYMLYNVEAFIDLFGGLETLERISNIEF